MDRVFESGAAVAAPAAPASPSNGYATAGNPATATPATKPGPYWYHMITESLRKLVVDAGLTPDHTNLSLVSQAVQAMIAAGAANDYKASVRAATVGANITLAGGAPSTLDGVTLVANDRILVKDQTTGSQNGIYVVTTLGTGANGTWSRATDADQAGELTSGAIVAVEEGTTNADSQWMLTTDGTITIGTTALTFTRKGEGSFASSAEAQAFSVTNKAISPATLAAAFQGANRSLATNGYQKLPGGLILQWGYSSVIGTNSSASVTLPIAFPTAMLNVIAIQADDLGTNESMGWAVLGFSTTGFTIKHYSGQGTARAAFWFAIGY